MRFLVCGVDFMNHDLTTKLQWSVRDTLEQIDLTKRFVAQYPNHLQLCTEPLCVRSAHKAGKVASMIGIEGGHQTGNSLGALRLMFDMGARYVTITHNCDNAYATAWSSVDKTKTGRDADPGLTDFGRELVQEMNRLGMLVDISHVSPNAMRDVLDVAQAPVIFSHSGAYGVHPMGRNVPDDVLRRLKKNGGVVMVPTISFFLRDKNPEEATVEDVVDHIMHIAEVAGWEHVGIGSDFDGSTVVAKGIEVCFVLGTSLSFVRFLTDTRIPRNIPTWSLESLHVVPQMSRPNCLLGTTCYARGPRPRKLRRSYRVKGNCPTKPTMRADCGSRILEI